MKHHVFAEQRLFCSTVAGPDCRSLRRGRIFDLLSVYTARLLSWEAISVLKSKSVAAGPVIRRAPRLNVRSWSAHWMNTRMRLWNWTRYIRWMHAQTSQAGNPETWTPKIFATAAHRPMTAMSPLSKYLKGGSALAPRTFLTIDF